MITTFKQLVHAVKAISPVGEYVSVIVNYNIHEDRERLWIHVYSETTRHGQDRDNFQDAFTDYDLARKGISSQSPLEAVDAEAL